jgi:hypothetical protein
MKKTAGAGPQEDPLNADVLTTRVADGIACAIAAAKNLVNQVSVPPADRLLDAITSFETR